ncbi:MAG: hypothetical protein H6710_20625 [Myxococcales bacterium]|nr:hypothetical protein [Myxococcales bacterium]
MSGARRRVTALALALALAPSCGPDEEGLESAEGERITLRFVAGFELCSGTLPTTDRWIEHAANQVGLDPDALGPLTYTWLDRARYRDASPAWVDDRGGWALGSAAIGLRPVHRHEIVHLMANTKAEEASAFLTEGLAAALVPELPLLRLDPRDEIAVRYPALRYEVAGGFVAFLLARFGPQRLWELYDDVGYLASAGRFRRRFARIYGLDLDAAVEEYLSGSTCPDDTLQIPAPPACAGDEVPWVRDDLWVLARTVECVQPDVAGGVGGEVDEAELAVTLEIPETGEYAVSVSAEDLGAISLVRCGGCPWLSHERFDLERPLHLAAGRHALVVRGRASIPGVVAVAIQPSL